jgi:hypothetical protein
VGNINSLALFHANVRGKESVVFLPTPTVPTQSYCNLSLSCTVQYGCMLLATLFREKTTTERDLQCTHNATKQQSSYYACIRYQYLVVYFSDSQLAERYCRSFLFSRVLCIVLRPVRSSTVHFALAARLLLIITDLTRPTFSFHARHTRHHHRKEDVLQNVENVE